MPALLLAALLAASPTPQPFQRLFAFSLEGERVGAVRIGFDGRTYRYDSTTVIREGKRLSVHRAGCTTDPSGVGKTDDGRALTGPLPSTAALWLFANDGARRCIDVEDEHDGRRGQVCAVRNGNSLRGLLLGEPFEAELGADQGPVELTLPKQHARFSATTAEDLPLPRPRDLFARARPAGALASLEHLDHAVIHIAGAECGGTLTLARQTPKVDPPLPPPPARDVWTHRASENTRGIRGQWAAARALAAFVEKAIAPGAPGPDERDAARVWSARQAGCVGHAFLFAALARSLGLEARVVYGALVEDGQVQAHAWDEVIIGGHAYGLDPSRGAAPIGPEHLPLARSTDADPLRAGRCLLALPELRISVEP